MDSKNLKVSIEKPCDKKWDSFSVNENGGYCSKCRTTVIDFTNYSNTEILQYLKSNNHKVCGKLKKDQNQIQPTLARKFQSNIAFKIIASLFLFTGSEKIVAKNQFSQEKNIIANQAAQKTARFEFQMIKNDSTKNFIQGKVLDSQSKMELPGATILIRKTAIGTVTNKKGEFKLVIPEDEAKKNIELSISFIGYERIFLKLKKDQLPIFQDFELKESNEVLIGEIIITKNRNKWWQFWKKKYKPLKY